jgi:hypothetical protein
MTESNVYWWIPFGINFILYGGCCVLILKRKNLSMISVRSPTLLLGTIIGNFLMSLVIIVSQLIEIKKDKNSGIFITSFYYLFRLMMIVSIFLRNERIILCCGINTNDTTDMKQFYDKRYLFVEKFYVRILLGFLATFFIVTIVILIIGEPYLEIFYIDRGEELNEVKTWIWIIWNFMEEFILLTYLFRIYDIISPKQFVKFELYSYLIVWVVYNNFSLIFYFWIKDSNKKATMDIVSLAVLYACLILDGIMPVVMSFIVSKTLLNYHFTFKLMNNLYLFLTDETCYNSFNNYLINKYKEAKINKEIDGKYGAFYLKLYTHIMKYKLDFVLNKDAEQLFNEAVLIYNTFFLDDSNAIKLDPIVVRKVKAECNILNSRNYNNNLFDEALSYIYAELTKLFGEFVKSREYSELYAEITLSSYIRCKMYNTGLINKF